MKLSPAILIRTYPHYVPSVPTNRQRINDWNSVKPVELGNSIKWKWHNNRKTRNANQ